VSAASLTLEPFNLLISPAFHPLTPKPPSISLTPRIKIHPIYGNFQVEVNAWWEWFLLVLASRCFSSGVTTIQAGDPTEFIAVENRSHNFLKP
jgi:hypothetical protein